MEDFVREKRILWIRRIILFFISILILRAFYLQVIRGSIYQYQSEQNHIRQIPINPPRGLISDRHGKILADNRPTYSLFVIPFDFQKNPIDSTILNQILGITPDQIQKSIQEASNHPFLPIRLVRDMDFAMLSRFEENSHDLPGMFYEVEALRTYTSGSLAAHVLGYVGEVDPIELSGKESLYNFGDIIGKAGVEKQVNLTLWGKRGYRYVEVDVRGRQVGHFEGMRDIPPQPGKDVRLTIDYPLQCLAEKLLKNEVGTLIAMNPQNGEILAMASKPDFQPGNFALGFSHSQWDSLRSHPQNPLLHRAIQAQLPPGSTFKLVTAAAGLKQGVIHLSDTVRCQGSFQLGKRWFDCWKTEGHGSVDFSSAIKVSCNVYFYQMNLKTGLKPWAEMAKCFGFGKPTLIDLPGEEQGILPNQSYLDEKYGANQWSRGVLCNLAVGQGDILVTPIQMVLMTAIIAQKGSCALPRIILGGSQQKSTSTYSNIELFNRDKFLSDKYFQLIQNGMFRVVNEGGGTGLAAHVPNISICGKTGTAENPRGEPHSWFIGFGPKEEAEIAVAVVIEHGGSGGGKAASSAGQFLQHYFEKR